MNRHPLTLPQLLEQIERYFDCSLTDAEERALRDEIAVTPLSHPAIDEARALMGFRRVQETAIRRSSRPTALRAAVSIAAAIALVVTLALHFLSAPSMAGTETDGGTCVAYVNGCRITDEADVVRLMMADLHEFESNVDDVETALTDDIGDITALLQSYENNFPEI
ncbi:MAG: hypothetical protein K2M71_04225 [Duncaniella sp.]|nr:hypothetical protein [Duncaniella sp.]